MNVLVAHFTSESNEHVKQQRQLDGFILKYGSEMLDFMNIRDIFEPNDITLIPTIYANGHSAGLVSKNAFDYISERILQGVKDQLHEIDGLFLFLHGASKVANLDGGSGDHYILREIRKLVGPYMPIAVVMDPHGNLSSEFANHATIVRSYRQSPHTDAEETLRKTAGMLVELLQNRRNIKPVYRKIPLILGGERCVSTDEPMRSINKLLDNAEQDNRILSTSYHIGYIRHDSPYCGAGVIVVPKEEKDTAYANEVADQLAKDIFAKRHEFHYTGLAKDPMEALDDALAFPNKPVFMTDSGDNQTSGAPGENTYVLRQFLNVKDLKKKVLFGAIVDGEVHSQLQSKLIGESVEFVLGSGEDEMKQPVTLRGTVKSTGILNHYHGETANLGKTITLILENEMIDVMILPISIALVELRQFQNAGVDIDEYDIIVVKQGYLFPELKEIAKFSVMSLTDGPTNQRSETIPFKLIMRPMYPMDEM